MQDLNYVSQVYYNKFLQQHNPRVWFKLMALNLDLLPYQDTKTLCKHAFYTFNHLERQLTNNELINYNQVFIDGTKHNDVFIMQYAYQHGANVDRILKLVLKIIRKNNFYLANNYMVQLYNNSINKIIDNDKSYWMYCSIFNKPLSYFLDLIMVITNINKTSPHSHGIFIHRFIKYLLRDNYINLLHYMLLQLISQDKITYLSYINVINYILQYPDIVNIMLVKSAGFKYWYMRRKLYQSIIDDNWTEFNAILDDNFEVLCLTENIITDYISSTPDWCQERAEHYIELVIDNIPYHDNIDRYITKLLQLYPQLKIKSKANNSFGWLKYLYQRDIFVPIHTDLNAEQLTKLFQIAKTNYNSEIIEYITSPIYLRNVINMGYINSLISLIQCEIIGQDQLINLVIFNHRNRSDNQINHNFITSLNIEVVEYLLQYNWLIKYCKNSFLYITFKYNRFQLVDKLLQNAAKLSVIDGLYALQHDYTAQKLQYFYQVIKYSVNEYDFNLKLIMEWAVDNNCKELFNFAKDYSYEIASNIKMNNMEKKYFLG